MRINREFFLGPNLPQNGFWGRNFENLTPDSESASSRYHVCQFSGKTDNFDFFSPNLPENGFWSCNVKNLSPDSESPPPRYHVCQFSVKADNFKFFGLNLGKLANYVWHFGSNNVEGVAESWVEAEKGCVEVRGAGWRWVHRLTISLKKRITSFRYIRNIPICM